MHKKSKLLLLGCIFCKPDAGLGQRTIHHQHNQIRCSIVVSISACHAEDPGSIPGGGGLCPQMLDADSPHSRRCFCTPPKNLVFLESHPRRGGGEKFFNFSLSPPPPPPSSFSSPPSSAAPSAPGYVSNCSKTAAVRNLRGSVFMAGHHENSPNFWWRFTLTENLQLTAFARCSQETVVKDTLLCKYSRGDNEKIRHGMQPAKMLNRLQRHTHRPNDHRQM